jgi:hypothetical protein
MLSRPLRGISLVFGLCLAAPASARECWADFFDKANFEGARVRVEGPAELPSLRSLQGEDWSSRIESLRVGADAEVVAYRRPGFDTATTEPVNHPYAFKSWGQQELPAYQELEIGFGPGKSEHHLGELNFHRNINSLKVRCRR